MTSNDLSNVQLHLVDNVETAGKFLSWLGERRPHNGAVSIDIETGEVPGNPKTDAFSPWRGNVRLAQVGDAEQGWAIPWDEWKGVFYQGMMQYTAPVVCHNIAFEGLWFDVATHYKLPWHIAHDTMIMSRLIDPTASAALKTIAAQKVDYQAVALQDTLNEGFKENGWTWGTVPINYQPYWAYGALDTVLTMRIFEQFWPKVQPGAEYSMPYELEMETRRIATRMESNGARVDLQYSEQKYDELIAKSAKAKAWVQSNYRASITSNVQLIGVFEGMGARFTDVTPSGQKSMTKEQLQLFVNTGSAEVSQLARVVSEQRKADKIAAAYFKNFIEGNIDGIMHPSIKTLEARTGRMSITDPALQTLPSGDATVRRAFLPREEDQSIITSDLDQVEFRLTANLSTDDALIALFQEADRTGGDVFTSIMRQVYRDETLQKSDPRRKLIKGVVYGKLYGAGPEKMALTAGVPVEQMKEVVDAFDIAYPGVKTLQKAIENMGSKRLRNEGVGYVLTRTGRRLPCDSNRVYALTNYLIQASAAEVFKANLVKLDQQELTEYMVVPVHDEIVLSVPTADAKDIMETVKECMTTTEGWEVPLTSGVDGPFENWGGNYKQAA